MGGYSQANTARAVLGGAELSPFIRNLLLKSDYLNKLEKKALKLAEKLKYLNIRYFLIKNGN